MGKGFIVAQEVKAAENTMITGMSPMLSNSLQFSSNLLVKLKTFLEAAMRTKTKISLRIDDDLLKVLKNNSTGNLTAYIEDLLLKGLITDLAEVNEQIKFGRDFKNFVNNTRDEFEAHMKTSTIFYKKWFSN